jgi:tetratricopeptide (TPR) repeat protein
MKALLAFGALALVLVACTTARHTPLTDGRIALDNLDHLIARAADDPAAVDLLLLRAQVLAQPEDLARVEALTEGHAASGADLLRRARARAALHRFADALADLDAAERSGVPASRLLAMRSSILIASGRPAETLPALRTALAQDPGFATRCALAQGLAATGRLEDADALYVEALHDLDTSSPFPFAAVWFARGVMWTEQGGDARRGETMYRLVLRHLPDHVGANVHLAELALARGDALAPVIARLERLSARSGDPELMALLGRLHLSAGDRGLGRAAVQAARQRYEQLLARHPLAYADHAAEFFLGVGDDAAQAQHWASLNLAARPTRRAHALAARATRSPEAARALRSRMAERFDARAG